MRPFLVVLAFLFALAGRPASGQFLDQIPLRVTGGVGFAAEAYASSGISARRAPLTGRAFASTRFSLFGLSSGLNLTFSTDQSRLRQRVNRLAFNTDWSWGTAGAGDVSPSFSRYSLNGVTVRGAFVELEPGPFSIALTGGQSRRPVEFSAREEFRKAAYRRMLYGGRIGYGTPRGNRVQLISVYSRDLLSSVDDPGEARPRENLTLTPQVGLSLLQGRISFEGQITASALTPDVRNPRASDRSAPAYFLGLMQPRTGTYYDYAGTADFRLNLDMFGLGLGYSRIQPGFESLGLPQVRSDQQNIRIQPRLQLLDRRLNVSFNFGHTRNNLQDQLLSTLERLQLGANVQARLTDAITLSGSYMRLNNKNEPTSEAPPGTRKQRHVSQVFMLTPVWSLQREQATSHTVALSASYQSMEDRTPSAMTAGGPANYAYNVTSTLNYTLRLPSGLMFTATGNGLRSDASSAETLVGALTLGTGYGFLEGALLLNVNGGFSRNEINVDVPEGLRTTTSSQVTGTANASYRLPNDDMIRLQVRGLSSSSSARERDFREIMTTLRFDHRF